MKTKRCKSLESLAAIVDSWLALFMVFSAMNQTLTNQDRTNQDRMNQGEPKENHKKENGNSVHLAERVRAISA